MAVTSKQYAYFPSNARIYSYRHATEILTIIAEPLSSATRLHDQTTECTNADGGPAGDAHRSQGLAPGEFACFEPVTYSFCEGGGDSSSTSTNSSGDNEASTENSDNVEPTPPSATDEDEQSVTVTSAAANVMATTWTIAASVVVLVSLLLSDA